MSSDKDHTVVRQGEPSFPLRFLVAARTNVGACRDRNEDVFIIMAPGLNATQGPPILRASLTTTAVVCGVFDGCGGSTSADQPSHFVARRVEDGLCRITWPAPAEVLGDMLIELLQNAAQQLFPHAAATPEYRGMGTTATLIGAVNDRLQLAHIGDTRAYLFRNGTLQQLSVDHTLLTEALASGRLTPAAAQNFVHRNVLLRAIGTTPTVSIDRASVDVKPNDIVLLCSDGLHGMVDDDRIRTILLNMETPEQSCDALIEAAEQAGGHDNETVVLMKIGVAS